MSWMVRRRSVLSGGVWGVVARREGKGRGAGCQRRATRCVLLDQGMRNVTGTGRHGWETLMLARKH